MAFVNVRLIAPGGRRYRVDIDSDLNVETVKSQLVKKLQMPPDKKYTLHLVDSFSLSVGDEVLLVELEEEAIRHLEPDDE
jgi:hypothetical protein